MLRMYRDWRLEMAAQTASLIGDWASVIALAVLISVRTGRLWMGAVVFFASSLASILGLVLTGRAESHPPRTVLVTCDMFRAACYCIVAVFMPSWPVIVLFVVAAGFVTNPAAGAQGNLLALIVRRSGKSEEEQDREIAMGSLQSALFYQLAIMAGAALGGTLYYLLGARLAIAANSASFVLSGLLFGLMHVGREIPKQSPKLRASLAAGWARIRWDPFVFRSFLMANFGLLGARAGESVMGSYVEGTIGAKYLAAATIMVPVGAILGIVYGRRPSVVGGSALNRLRVAAHILVIGSAVATVGFAISGLLGEMLALLGTGFAFGTIPVVKSVVVARLKQEGPEGALDLGRLAAFAILDAGLRAGDMLAAAVGAGLMAALGSQLGITVVSATGMAYGLAVIRIGSLREKKDVSLCSDSLANLG